LLGDGTNPICEFEDLDEINSLIAEVAENSHRVRRVGSAGTEDAPRVTFPLACRYVLIKCFAFAV